MRPKFAATAGLIGSVGVWAAIAGGYGSFWPHVIFPPVVIAYGVALSVPNSATVRALRIAGAVALLSGFLGGFVVALPPLAIVAIASFLAREQQSSQMVQLEPTQTRAMMILSPIAFVIVALTALAAIIWIPDKTEARVYITPLVSGSIFVIGVGIYALVTRRPRLLRAVGVATLALTFMYLYPFGVLLPLAAAAILLPIERQLRARKDTDLKGSGSAPTLSPS